VVTLLDRVLRPLKSKDERLQLSNRKLLAARFAGLECPGALEFPDLLLEVRILVRQGAGPAGRGEPDGAEQCYKKDSHTCSPKLVVSRTAQPYAIADARRHANANIIASRAAVGAAS